MLWTDVIELVIETSGKNDIGDAIKQPTYRKVFANEKGIRQSEFYQAAATKLRPEIMYEIRKVDYAGEKKIRVNKTKLYNIIRTYPVKNEMLELVCQGLVNNAGT